MTTAAIIPARGGSKRLPRKNLATVGGKTLVTRAIESAAPCDAVYVSTDCTEIAEVAHQAGAHVVWRPSELATDTTSTEAVVDHWWRSLPLQERPDVLALLQPTSPLRTAAHVAEALALLELSDADSVVSVQVNSHAHFAGRSVNRGRWYQFQPMRAIEHRPRTQELPTITEENGAIYLTRRESWLMTLNRMGGTVAEYRMSKRHSVDVDSAEDLAIAEAFLRTLEPE